MKTQCYFFLIIVYFECSLCCLEQLLQGVPVRVGPVSMLHNICFFWHQDSRICCCFSFIFLVQLSFVAVVVVVVFAFLFQFLAMPHGV